MRKQFLLVAVVYLFFLCVVGFVFVMKYLHEKESILDMTTNNLQQEVFLVTEKVSESADIYFKTLIDKKPVKKLFKNRDRTALYQLLTDDYKILADNGFYILHFHLPDNTSFLRMHRPQKFGDDLSSIRHDVRYVNETQTVIRGWEMGRILPAYRNIYPIFDDRQYLGSVEISYQMDKFLEYNEEVYALHAHFLLGKDVFRDKQMFLKDASQYRQSVIDEHYLEKINDKVDHPIDNDYMDHVKDNVKQMIHDGIAQQKAFSVEFDFSHQVALGSEEHTHHSMSFFPLMNTQNKRLGNLLIFSGNMYLKELERDYKHFIISTFIIISIVFLWILKNVSYTLKLQDLVRQRTEELEKSRDEALAAVEVKSRFLANMSHEIRTPMNAILGMSELALDEPLESRPKNYIKKVHSAAEGLLVVINDILDFSKIEAGKLEFSFHHFKLNSIISKTIHLLGISAKDKGVKIKVILEKNVPHFYYSDDLRLGQVLINLSNNAIKFSNQGGVLTLGVSLLEENDTDATLQFSVRDEGIGISEANQKKLFHSFTQAESSTTRKFGGTGLGLAIAKKIVKQMGGEIWVESEEGKGSTFNFTVRMKKSDEEALLMSAKGTPQEAEYAVAKLRGSNVLLVEDNALNQELAEDLLSKNGMHVTIAHHGEEALDILKTKEFDIVLMDIQMPVMDGYEATRQIRSDQKFQELPIIAMTANIMEEDLKKAEAAGMNDHIGKPIKPAEMFSTMAKWMKK